MNPFDAFDSGKAAESNPFDQFDNWKPASNPFDQFDPEFSLPETIGQGVLEAHKGFARGAVSAVGTGIAGLPAFDPSRPIYRDLAKYREDFLRLDEMSSEERNALADKLEAEPALSKRLLLGTVRDLLDPETRDQARQRLTELEAPTPIAETPLYKLGERIQQTAKEKAPVGKGWENSFTVTLSEGLGSLGTGLAASLIPGVGQATTGALFTAMGSGEAVQRAVEFDKQQRAAGKPGISDEEIAAAGILGTAPGATDILPVEFLLGRLKVPQPFRRPVARWIAKRGGQAFIEGIQEGGQQFLQNVIAQSYDEDATLGEDVLPSAGAGAGVGAIASTAESIITALTGRRGRGRATPPPTEEAPPEEVPEGAQPVEQLYPEPEEEPAAAPGTPPPPETPEEAAAAGQNPFDQFDEPAPAAEPAPPLEQPQIPEEITDAGRIREDSRLAEEEGPVGQGGEVAGGEDLERQAPEQPGGAELRQEEEAPDAARVAGEIDEAVETLRQEADRPAEELPAFEPDARIEPRPDRSAGVYSFDPLELRVDAERFQFRSGTDTEGVNETLRGVENWRAERGNQIIVWQDNDGRLYVADGHQRTGLARRLIEEGREADIRIPGVLFRESDGISSDDVMVIAALKNIGEGSTSPVDAARVLRTSGEEALADLPLPKEAVRSAVDLSKLSDEAWGMVINEVVEPNHAKYAGRFLPNDPDRQVAAMKALARAEPANEDEAAVLVRRVAAAELAKTEEGAQASMFEEGPDSTAIEEVKIVAGAVRQLRGDRRLFSRLVREADRIEATGSRIEREGASAAVSQADRLATVVEAVAFRAGPIRDTLKTLAQEVKNGDRSLAAARTAFVDALRRQETAVGETGVGAGEEAAVKRRAPAEETAPAREAAPERVAATAEEPSPWEMTKAEFDAALEAQPNTVKPTKTVVDWGTRPRGQGKRAGGMIRGAMSDAPTGKKTYLNPFGNLPDFEQNGDEMRMLRDAEIIDYLKARSMDLDHDDAMLVAWAGDQAYARIAERHGATGELFEEGAEGKPQAVLPGTEREGQRTQAQRKADKRLKPKREQRPMDYGLFSDESQQADLLDFIGKRIGRTDLETEVADLRQILDGGASEEIISDHPLIRQALAAMRAVPATHENPDFGSANWWRTRRFIVDGREVVGLEEGVAAIYDRFAVMAWEEDGLQPERLSRDRRAFVVTGPPASGKSRIANPIARANGAAIIDADEIKKMLPEFGNGIGASAVHEESSIISKGVLNDMMAEGINVVLPKVTGGRKLVQQLKEAGYEVSMVYMDVTPDEAFRRMIRRFLNTGRLVNTTYMREIGTSPRTTYQAIKNQGEADVFIEIDNNGRAPKVVDDEAGILAGISLGRPGREGGAGRGVGRPELGNREEGGQRRLEEAPRQAVTPKIDAAKQRQIERQASAIISRIAGRRVQVQFRAQIGLEETLPQSEIMKLSAAAEARGARLRPTIGGYYELNAEPIIAIATNDPYFDPQTTAGHEAWHHVETVMLTRAERAMLARDMPRVTELAAQERNIPSADMARYPRYEITAIAFQRYRRMKEEGSPLRIFPTPIRRIFEKLFKAFSQIRDMLRRQGVQRFEDVFEAARTGEIARAMGEDRVEPSFAEELLAGAGREASSFEETSARVDEIANVTRYALFGTYQQSRIDQLRARFQKVTDPVRLRIQDRYLAVKRMQQEFERVVGINIQTPLDVYQAIRIYIGRAGERLVEFKKRHVEPLVEDMRSRDISTRELDDYLYARHAPERNAEMAKINPNLPDGSGMSDTEAADIIDRINRSGKMADYQALARRVDAMITATRNEMLRRGLIDQQTAFAWQQTYNHYVPLRGFDDPAAALDQFGIGVGKGFDVRGPETQRAFGRRSRADSPFAYVVQQAERAIVRGEKNRVLQTVYAFSQDPTVAAEDIFKINPAKMKKRVNPTTGIVESYLVPPQFSRAENLFSFKLNGKSFWIEVNDPGFARALRGVGAPSADNAVASGLLRISHTYAALLTQWNPEFVPTNAVRDIQTALVNVQEFSNLASGTKRRILKDAFTLKSIRGALAAMYDRQSTNEMKRYYDEFRFAGGKVSFVELNDIERIKRKIDAALSAGQMRRSLGNLADIVGNLNTAVENGVRLSVYANLRQAGVDASKAALIARDLTTDFNLRGEWSPMINAMYIFFNASLQGGMRLSRAVVRSKGARRAVAGIFTLGFSLHFFNLLMQGLGDDDKKYDEIPDWIHENNLVLMLPNGNYVKLPLAYGYNVPFVAGSRLAAVLTGQRKPGQAAATLGAAFMNSFNPLGSFGSLSQLAAPWFVDPIVQAGENRTFYGGPIMPKIYDERKPLSETYFKSAPDWAVELAKELNEATGGNVGRPGQLDISPEIIQHYAEFLGGGVSRFLVRSINTTERMLRGEEWLPEETPLLRRFYSRADTKAAQQRRYYEVLPDVEQAHYEQTQLLGAGSTEEAERQRRRFARELEAYPAFHAAQLSMRKIRKARNAVERMPAGPERDRQLENLESAEVRLIQSALEAYDQANPEAGSPPDKL